MKDVQGHFDINGFNKLLDHIDRDKKNFGCLSGIFNKMKIDASHRFKILDVGCGYGQFSMFFAEEYINRGFDADMLKIHCIDPCEEILTACEKSFQGKAYYNRAVFSGTPAEKYINEHTNEKFNIIICSHVLYYFPNWRLMLKRLIMSLKPRGTMIVMQASSNCDLYDLYYSTFSYLNKKNICPHLPILFVEQVAGAIKNIPHIFNSKLNYVHPKISVPPEDAQALFSTDKRTSLSEIIEFAWHYPPSSFDGDCFRNCHMVYNYFKKNTDDFQKMLQIEMTNGILTFEAIHSR